MHGSILKTLASASLLVGQIAGVAVPGPLSDLQYDIEYDAADGSAPQAITYRENRARADEVRNAFRFAWNAYKGKALSNGVFTKDEVRPVSGKIRNSRYVPRLIELNC
jgi:hypothetical protein